MTLVEFLLAQIDADEQDANEDHMMGCGYWDEDEETAERFEPPHACTCAQVTPYRRSTPTQRLAGCEAKRGIIALHAVAEGYDDGRTIEACEVCGYPFEYPVYWPCETLRLLALPYSDHSDYDPEWAPSSASVPA